MKYCETVQMLVCSYLGGELEEKEVTWVQTHLEECEACRKLYRSEKEFLDHCKGSFAQIAIVAPPELKQKILRTLGLEIQRDVRLQFLAHCKPFSYSPPRFYN